MGEFLGSFNNLAPSFSRTRIEEDYIPWINILTRGPRWNPGPRRAWMRERESEKGEEKWTEGTEREGGQKRKQVKSRVTKSLAAPAV